MRLIDVDALKESIEKDTCPVNISYFYRKMREAHTVDAEPVRHGHWIMKQTSIGCEYTVCSSCQTDFKFKTNTGTLARLDMRGQNYCPNCGAKMDEVSE